MERFLANNPPPIDSVREEAARCAEETARYERGERPPLRYGNPLTSEFSDAAFGVAAEVALVVSDALKANAVRFEAAFCWSTAATLLRNGWQRGHRLVGKVLTGKAKA
jgi:hypothetical protein